ncbi:MAG: tetratricopeptide repeat protein [Bacteriovoracaceae bacterium]|nr:tetratricopeptide repeat protein [Bacteriovoracaceae bacterium]
MKKLIIFVLIFTISSCSFFSRRKSVSDQNDTVPKKQYDELMAKYQSLQNNMQQKKASSGSVGNGLITDLESATKAELVETVDVFSKEKNELQLPTDVVIENDIPVADQIVESQIIKLRKAEALIGKNRFNEALSLLKEELENSPVKQIKVKTKYLLGELLFKQGEYDLAMQIFEEIITQYAYSGIVIKTLGRLIVCCEKLKLSKKKEQYYSILHDFFEST